MKKILFFAAVFATALVSCSSDDNDAIIENQPEEALKVSRNIVSDLTVKTAGTTFSISPNSASRALTGNTIAFDGEDSVVINLQPILGENVKSYTCAASGFNLKYKPYDPKTGKGDDAHIYEKIDTVSAQATNYIKVTNGAKISIKDLNQLFLHAVPEGKAVDEWTYEVYIYPEIISEEVDTLTGNPTITNPFLNIMNTEAKNFGNLIGKAPFVKKDVPEMSHTQKWTITTKDGKKEEKSVTYTTPAHSYMEAQPDTIVSNKWLVRSIVYQGQNDCKGTSTTNKGIDYTYDYNYSYIKAAIHVQKAPKKD